MPRYAVIIAAAGAGRRFGASKVLAKMGERPLLLRAVELFVNREDVCQTVVAVSPADLPKVKKEYGPNLAFMGVQVVGGADRRCQTVRAALGAIREDADYVAVHDAARVCTTREMIDRVFDEATKSGSAILAAPLTGTIKQVSAAGVVDRTVSRDGLYEAQTPQVFRRDLLIGAYAALTDDCPATDDAEVVAAAGHPVTVVASDLSNLKITYRGDLILAAAIHKGRPTPKPSGPRGPFEEAQW